MAQPDRSEHASKELLASCNHLRLCLREYAALGAPAPQPKPAARPRVAQPKAKPTPERMPIDGLLDDMSRFLGAMDDEARVVRGLNGGRGGTPGR